MTGKLINEDRCGTVVACYQALAARFKMPWELRNGNVWTPILYSCTCRKDRLLFFNTSDNFHRMSPESSSSAVHLKTHKIKKDKSFPAQAKLQGASVKLNLSKRLRYEVSSHDMRLEVTLPTWRWWERLSLSPVPGGRLHVVAVCRWTVSSRSHLSSSRTHTARASSGAF